MVLVDRPSHHDEFMTEHILLCREFAIRGFVIIDEGYKNDAKHDEDNEELIYRTPDLPMPLLVFDAIHYFQCPYLFLSVTFISYVNRHP